MVSKIITCLMGMKVSNYPQNLMDTGAGMDSLVPNQLHTPKSIYT